MPLHVRKHDKISLEESTETLDIASSTISRSVSKGHRALEKRIEGAWRESAMLGWSFTRFAAFMLEVLIVLQERDRLKAEKAKQQVRRG